MRQQAFDSEASGYFLVPDDLPLAKRWRIVELTEAGKVWGRGNTSATQPGALGDPLADKKKCSTPMCGYNIKESSVSLTLSDMPVGYDPAIGPSTRVTISYNQREDAQPANFNFYNIGQKWTLSWLSYVTDDPVNAGANVSRFLSGGGFAAYSGYVAATGRFANQADDGSVLTRISGSPVAYQRLLQDGTREIYALSDGATAFPRKVFLTQVIDPQGNALTLTYDNLRRVTSVTDAVGRQTTLTYAAAQSLMVTKITDPFGRSASLTYDSSARLTSFTDIRGLTSSFTYDANGLVNSMTTPYGTTTFAYTAPGTAAPPRFVQATDPMGFSEREEWLESAPIPASDPAATVPTGMPLVLTNGFLQFRNSFHWDKNAYVLASCTPAGGCDYTKARLSHFTHIAAGGAVKGMALESTKYPLENRVWYALPGQNVSANAGTYNQPSAVGRVLDDGTTQLYRYSYDTTGLFKLTQVTDPLGRITQFTYANGIDLLAITQATTPAYNPGGSMWTTIAQYTYDYRHRPVAYVDAAGQMTLMAYNVQGQLTSLTNPLGETTETSTTPRTTSRRSSTPTVRSMPATPTIPSPASGPTPIRKAGPSPTTTTPPTASPR